MTLQKKDDSISPTNLMVSDDESDVNNSKYSSLEPATLPGTSQNSNNLTQITSQINSSVSSQFSLKNINNHHGS